MYSSDKNVERIVQLLLELQQYVKLRKRLLQINTVEKTSKIVSSITLFVVIIAIGVIALYFLAMAAVHFISDITGYGMTASYTIVCIVLLLLIYLIYIMRDAWIYRPISGYIIHLLLNDDEHEAEEVDDEE
jgi:sterol desaturase/sphingolipid hydroxylase (fatty acid hydroxylase superfamily)